PTAYMGDRTFLAGAIGLFGSLLVGCGHGGGAPGIDGGNIGAVIPADRRVWWAPGIPGGIPSVTTVCATIDAATYGNGTTDATSAIQSAIDACATGVVHLPAGSYLITMALSMHSGVVL